MAVAIEDAPPSPDHTTLSVRAFPRRVRARIPRRSLTLTATAPSGIPAIYPDTAARTAATGPERVPSRQASVNGNAAAGSTGTNALPGRSGGNAPRT